MENSGLVRTETHVTLAAAQEAIAVGIAKAEELGVKIGIVVVDASSYFVAGLRMDGCRGKADEAAKGKAVFSLGTPKGTADFIENRLKHNEALWRAMASRTDIFPVQGGFPLRYGGRTVGGVGVSGAKHEEDSQVSEAAARHFNEAADRAAAESS